MTEKNSKPFNDKDFDGTKILKQMAEMASDKDSVVKIDVSYLLQDDSEWNALLTALKEIPEIHSRLQLLHLAGDLTELSTRTDEKENVQDDGETSKTTNNKLSADPRLDDLFAILAEKPQLERLELLDLNASVLSLRNVWKVLEHATLRDLTIRIVMEDCNMRLLHKLSRSTILQKLQLQLWMTKTATLETPLYLLTNSTSLEEIAVEAVNNTSPVLNQAHLSERKWKGLCQSLHTTRDTSRLRVLDMKTIGFPNTTSCNKVLDDLVEFNTQLEVLHAKIPEGEPEPDSGDFFPAAHKKKNNKKQGACDTAKTPTKSTVETITWIA